MIVRLTRELGVNKAGVEVILRLMHRIEGMHREMEEMMNFLEENIRKDFAERLNRIFSE
jgi:MerR family transcriptional regulator/heat shock protein HspR